MARLLHGRDNNEVFKNKLEEVHENFKDLSKRISACNTGERLLKSIDKITQIELKKPGVKFSEIAEIKRVPGYLKSMRRIA